MANIFPRWTNYLPLKIIFCLLVLGGAVSALYWYYLTPEYMRAGYQPIQPVPFSHNLEEAMMPSVDRIVAAVKEVCYR